MRTQEKNFAQKLASYKKLIDADIKKYSKSVQKETLQDYGAHSRIAVDAYLDMLGRGGKRIRGTLAMLAYEMSGGTNRKMILEAARAIELTHVYILIMDDINDRSTTRRGGPTVHYMLREYHAKHHLADDSLHFGESIAMNAALYGSHAAQSIMANLDAEPELRLRAIDALNKTMMITAHGQFNDIFNEVAEDVEEAQINSVYEWKTAHYTFLNPLKIGMILAGAANDELDAVTDYAMQAGRLFQITDDILGTFGSEFESGKSPLDDIKEGKQTLLVIKAIEMAPKADEYFLRKCLGNQRLTIKDFEKCKQIIADSGSFEYSRKEAEKAKSRAREGLIKMEPIWPAEGIGFLDQLVCDLARRKN